MYYVLIYTKHTFTTDIWVNNAERFTYMHYVVGSFMTKVNYCAEIKIKVLCRLGGYIFQG